MSWRDLILDELDRDFSRFIVAADPDRLLTEESLLEAIQDKGLKSIIGKIIKEEAITPRDFILPQIKELSAEGGERELLIKTEHLEISMTKEAGNTYKAIISFTLPKGSYATVIIDSLFNPQ